IDRVEDQEIVLAQLVDQRALALLQADENLAAVAGETRAQAEDPILEVLGFGADDFVRGRGAIRGAQIDVMLGVGPIDADESGGRIGGIAHRGGGSGFGGVRFWLWWCRGGCAQCLHRSPYRSSSPWGAKGSEYALGSHRYCRARKSPCSPRQD